jgi:TldD protein
MSGELSSEANGIIGNLQQAVGKVRLPYADGLYDWQMNLSIRKNKDRETISTGSIKGTSLRGFTHNGWVYANTNENNLNHINKLAKGLNKKNSGKGSAQLSLPEPIKLDKRVPLKKDPQEVPLEDKVQKLREIFNLARTMDSRIADLYVGYSETKLERILVTSDGTEARQVIQRTRIALVPVAKENGVTDSDVASLGGTVGYEIVDGLTEEVVRNTVNSAVEQLKAIQAPGGVHKVILDPGVVGVVCHESFGHGLEADQALRGRSYLKDMLGKKVASELVTMYEDPSYEGAHGSYYFDDDGTPSRKNTLVDNGKLVSFLHDIETSSAMKAPLTGNSRTQNATRRRFIRMSNTYAKPGDWNSAEMIKDTKDGILMMHWRSGMEDPLGGGMQVVAGKGYVIKNGEKTTPLKSLTLTGRVLDVLGGVDAVSKDGFRIESGNCGKGPEDFVPDGTGGTWWRTTAVIA